MRGLSEKGLVELHRKGHDYFASPHAEAGEFVKSLSQPVVADPFSMDVSAWPLMRNCSARILYNFPVAIWPLGIASTAQGLTHIDFQDGSRPVQWQPTWQADQGLLDEARRQLTEYFRGARQQFALPLAPLARRFSSTSGTLTTDSLWHQP